MKHFLPRSRVRFLFPVFLVLLLAACGGGSSGGADSGGNDGNDGDDGGANQAPTADAGIDQVVGDGALVTLDASASADADGDTLSYTWTQTEGETVSLDDASAAKPAFTAPMSVGGTTLRFELTVSDGSDSTTDSVTVTVNDITAATADVQFGGLRDDIVITFSEPMNTAALSLGDGLGAISDGGTWSDDNTVLTLAPDAMGAWESGDSELALNVEDASGNSTVLEEAVTMDFAISTFSSASVVIGQVDFTGTKANQDGTTIPDADTLLSNLGEPSMIEGRLWIPDRGNRRIVGFDGIPASNGASASYLIGQATFTDNTLGTSATLVGQPFRLLEHEGRYYLLDYLYHRILIYNAAPLSPPGTADDVIGQLDLDSGTPGCSATKLAYPHNMHIVDGKLLVADHSNHRILVWNIVPTAGGVAPDLVLGQESLTNCIANDDDQNGSTDNASARTLYGPHDVWSDGTRIAVADFYNSRVLIWNTFPTENFQPADIVIGQADFTHTRGNDDNQDGVAGDVSGRTLGMPRFVSSNGRQLLITDNNNRLLLWNSFPEESFPYADVVLGQSTFSNITHHDSDQDGTTDTASAQTLWSPQGAEFVRDKLIVQDTNRVLVFDAE